jgi:hypothetical protein
MTIVDRPTEPRSISAGPHASGAPGNLVGVEHEFVLRSGTRRVDARRALDLTSLAAPALDPGDAHARRLSWGGVVTFDGPELEIVTPPLVTRPGFASEVADDCARGRRDAAAFLPDGLRLEGFSTHLNVSVTPGREVVVAKRFIGAFSAAMMLLLDGTESPGILVRPRPGRLEVGGEYQAGSALVAALTFAVGAVRCCDVPRRTWTRSTRSHEAALVPMVERAVERFGWFIDRSAFGGDLYRAGRESVLPVRGGGTVRAAEHLAAAWHRAQRALGDDLGDAERQLVDAVLDGRLPLPCEATPATIDTFSAPSGAGSDSSRTIAELAAARRSPSRVARPATSDRAGEPSRRSPFGSLIVPRRRGSLRLSAEVVTWGFVVFALSDGTRSCHLTVPGRALEAFLERVDAGACDDEMHHHLDRPRKATLARVSQTRSVDAYGDLPDPAALLPPERDPVTGRFPRAGGPGGVGGGRPGKRHQQSARPPARPRWVRPMIVGGVALVVTAVIAVALSSRGDDKPTIAASGTTSPMSSTPATGGGQFADYGRWQSTAGTISLERRGDRLIGTVVEVAAVDQVPGCRLRVGQQLFSVTGEAPSTVDTTPSFPNARPFIGSGTGTLQRWNAGGGGCVAALTDDVPLFVVAGREGGQLPGSATVEPSLSLAKSPDLATTALPEWFPFDFRFTRVGAASTSTSSAPPASLTGASP